MTATIEEDFQLVVESIGATRIESEGGGGIYPQNFAEGESWGHIDAIMESVNCPNLEDANAELGLCILELIDQGIFESAENTSNVGKSW